MLDPLSRIAGALTRTTERWIPSAFAIACILSIGTFLLAWAATPASPSTILVAWGDGFWTLLPFAMQMGLVVLTGYIISTAPAVDRMLARVARWPGGPRQSVALVAAVSMALAWVHWGLSIVGGAMLVRHVAREQRGVDYRLLVAVAYFGLGATWHSGLSASAPLLVATPGHFLEDSIGVIPVSRTIFHPFNLGLTAISVVLLTGLAAALHPRPEQVVKVDPGALRSFEPIDRPAPPAGRTLAELLDHSPVLTWIVAAAGVVWLWWYFASRGFALTLDVLNFAALMVGVALHRTPASLLAAAERGGHLLAGVAIQFPFYAGIHGIVQGTGLAVVIGAWISQIASAATLPLVVYWYSGLVNYIVPSGGSKWAIEAPYLVEAAGSLGVSLDQIVLAYAWGDMATDLIQPFWALPLLAAARLDFRDIMGYELLVFAVYAAVVSIAFWCLPLLW